MRNVMKEIDFQLNKNVPNKTKNPSALSTLKYRLAK